MTSLEQSILATLAFFRLFGRPLMAPEVYQWLWYQDATLPSPEQVRQTLESLSAVQRRGNYFYLEEISTYPDRQAQQEVNAALRDKTMRYLPLLRRIPGIRFCGVGNTVAFDAADAPSDIDVFIIARPEMLWWVRWWSTLILHILGVRRHGNKVAARFCLSFFVDETAMDLERVAIDGDIYLRYWISTLLPVFGGATLRRFQEANHNFVTSHIPHAFEELPALPDCGMPRLEAFLLGWGKPLLMLPRWLQRMKMRHLPVLLGPGAFVVVNDHMLKFHNNDRRQHFRDSWKAAMAKYS